MKLHFREYGSGPPVIILHGLMGSCDNWVTLGKQLGETHHVYLVDQRNHGQSPHSDAFDYAHMAEDLRTFIDDHNIKSPVIVGHSMGGKTAMCFTIKYPDALSRLVVVDIAPKYYPVHHQKILAGLKAINLDTLSSRNEAEEQLKKHIPEWGVRQFLLKNLYRSDNGFAWRFNLNIIDEKIENVGEAIEGTSKVETLFINGEKSDYITKSDTTNIKAHFPNATLVTIKEAGHWVHAEKPEDFINTLTSFIK